MAFCSLLIVAQTTIGFSQTKSDTLKPSSQPRDGQQDLTADSGCSEQAFSDDGGKTWETNWINVYTRVKEEAAKP